MIGVFFLELKENNLNVLIENFDDIINIKNCNLFYYHNNEWKEFHYYFPDKTVPHGEYTGYPNKLFNKDALIARIGCDSEFMSIILSNTFKLLTNDEVIVKGFETNSNRYYFTLKFAKMLKLIGNGSYHYNSLKNKNKICSREKIEEYILNNSDDDLYDYDNFDRYYDYNFNNYSEDLFNHAFIPINSYEHYDFGIFEMETLWMQYLCTDGEKEFIVTDVE